MNIKPIFLCATMLVTWTASAFELPSFGQYFLENKVTGEAAQLRDSTFEIDVSMAILESKPLTKGAQITVSRTGDTVLIVGQAKTAELKSRIQEIVLEAANLQWTQGDVNNVEPSNAQVCGKKAAKVAANDRRRFNLKAAEECSTVNRFYNEVEVTELMGAIEQSDDDLLRATILNQLLHARLIENAGTVKVVVSDHKAYLLGDQLTQKVAEQVTAFVNTMPTVSKVVPLFRF